MAAGSQADAYEIGDVIYCSSETGGYADGTDTKITLWSERFKFQIKQDNSGNKIVKFGEGGYFSQSTKNIVYLGRTLLEVKDEISVFKLSDERFYYGFASVVGAGFLNGTCDKF
tara:strand:+ start:181 stop:522 length:342 start_codon:yes stop_codon:yes gene_type:complete